MVAQPEISVQKGLAETHREHAAELYWEAFAPKLGLALRPDHKAKTLLAQCFALPFCFTATHPDGTLLGVAGFKTTAGTFVDATQSQLKATYGMPSAFFRGLLLHILERKSSDGTIMLDGICVAGHARGLGIGSKLLDAICDHATNQNYERVRLDVIDTNPRARALYERKGFQAVHTASMGPLRHLFGFRHSTTMILPVADRSDGATG